jgi:opacity protein-like surface antigen
MKKVFVLIASAIVCMSAMAQVQFGGKVGFDMTHFWGQGIDHGMKPGYQVGLMMEYKFSSRFAIAPEVVFAAQGGKDKLFLLDIDQHGIEFVSSAGMKYNANYINVPVMLKYYATLNFSVDFGPQVGFNVYHKITAKKTNESIDIKDSTKPVDFGLGLGATYNLTDNAFVQARYTMGLTKVFKDEEVIGENNAKNGNVQIAFGMKF